MTRDAFWAIVDATVSDSRKTQMKRLRTALKARPDEEVAAFACWLDRVLDEIDSPALMRAAEIVFDGTSDDGYEYFRLWIVAMGRTACERIAADPARVLERLGEDPDAADYEEFANPAFEVLEARLGDEPAWDLIDATAEALEAAEGEPVPVGPESFDEAPLRARIASDQALQARRAQAQKDAQAWLAEGAREQTRDGIPIGARVEHAVFGAGTLMQVQEFDEGESVIVQFDSGETELLALGPEYPEIRQVS